MKVLLSWIREFVDVPGIGRRDRHADVACAGWRSKASSRTATMPCSTSRSRANRPDCLSMIGHRARDRDGVRAAADGDRGDRLRSRQLSDRRSRRSAGSTRSPVTIDEPDLCGRYVGAVADVTIGPSPDWMQDAARPPAACGRSATSSTSPTTCCSSSASRCTRSTSRRLRGPAIVVRRAQPGETLTTLDGKKRTLDARHAGHCRRRARRGDRRRDGRRELGGLEQRRTRIVFEARGSSRSRCARRARSLGLQTEASMRFERGADRHGSAARDGAGAASCSRRSARARQRHRYRRLPRSVSAEADAAGSRAHRRPARHGRAGRCGRAHPDVARLRGLARRTAHDPRPRRAGTSSAARGASTCIARSISSRKSAATTASSTCRRRSPASSRRRRRRIRASRATRACARALLGMGFSEAITFAFIEAAAAAPFLERRAAGRARQPAVREVRRRCGRACCPVWSMPSATTGATAGATSGCSRSARASRRAARRARRRSRGRARPRPTTGAARGATSTSSTSRAWSSNSRRSRRVAVDVRARSNARSWSHGRAASDRDRRPGRSACSASSSPAIAEARDLPAADEVYVAEIDLDALTRRVADRDAHARRRCRAIPSVVRDMSILVDDTLSAATVRGTIRSAAPDTLVAGARVRSVPGQGHSGRQGQPVVPPDVPVARADADRRRSAARP